MPAPSGYPAPVVRLISNVEETRRLVDIHASLTGSGSGRRHNVEVLNKSGIVLLVACWEAFVEDLATTSFDSLLAASNSPGDIPKSVLALASRPLRESPDESKVWDLAQGGWKAVLGAHRSALLERHIGRFNTPKPENVDSLFEKLIGLKTLSDAWYWPRNSSTASRKRLNTLVELRGGIAHRVVAHRAVHKRDVERSIDFISYLAAKSSNAVHSHLESLTGTEPWGLVRYGSVR